MKLANVPRGVLFGAPIALLVAISTLSIVVTRRAGSAPPPLPPPIDPGSILLVVRDEHDPSGSGQHGAVGSAVEAALAKSGRPVADASYMWSQLVYGEAPLNTGRIDTSMPLGWPAALRHDWEHARALCVEKSGRPPYGLTNLPAYLCGLKIAPVLWQKWLDDRRAAHVVVVSVTRNNPNDPRQDGWNVEVSAYEPGSIDDYRIFRGELRPEATPAAAADLAVRAMGGEGRIIHRTVEREMPDSPNYHTIAVPALGNDGIPVRKP